MLVPLLTNAQAATAPKARLQSVILLLIVHSTTETADIVGHLQLLLTAL
jgi:hypothetical protein